LAGLCVGEEESTKNYDQKELLGSLRQPGCQNIQAKVGESLFFELECEPWTCLSLHVTGAI